MEMKINEFLANKQVLFVMDNIDDCLKNNEDDLKTLLTNLLDKNQGLKILATSRQKINNLGEITEKVFELKELDSSYSIQLLEKKAGRKIEKDEIEELFNRKPPKNMSFIPS